MQDTLPIFRKAYYAGIFLVAAASLLLEIALTKVFSVIHFHYFAFFIISTALFGYGFSGVFISVSKKVAKAEKNKLLLISSWLFAATIVIAYGLILILPLRMSGLLSDPWQWLYLALVYLLLAIPFFFSGLVIGILLSSFSDQINRLYFADLTGAAIGCFGIVVLIPIFEGSGTVLLSAVVAFAAAIIFSQSWRGRVASIVGAVVIAAMVPFGERLFPSANQSEKRYFHQSQQEGRLLFTGWSPASRIDVVTINPQRRVIWIDGGSNQSFMVRVSRKRRVEIPEAEFTSRIIEIPYRLVNKPSVMIIGPGGGVEVASALAYNPSRVTAVELDPLITKIMLNNFSGFVGNIYHDPKVQLVNEEGRSFIRRSSEKYDIIQQRNNSHPMAVASGALNLTETYLLTKEAFHEYLDHLNPNGFLSIERHGGIRLLNLAAEVLKQRGVQEYAKHVTLIREDELNQVLLLKNGAFTASELDYIQRFCKRTNDEILFIPGMEERNDGVFARLMREDTRERTVRKAPYHLEAPTDDKPFIEHFYRLETLFSKDLKRKLYQPFWAAASLELFTSGEGTYSDFSLYLILAEAILLSTIFILYPLIRLKRSGIEMKGAGRLIGYYFCLGIGFILIEIAFIQKYILFIGYPVYAVAAIIFSLLIAAGLGSYFSNRFKDRPFSLLGFVVVGLLLITALQIYAIPALFKQFISSPFPVRMMLSILFILPAGFLMGMPFPTGLSWTSKRFPEFVPWAWGINGYATVIGSVLSVILALNFGFRAVLWIAACTYILAYLLLYSLRLSGKQIQ